MIETYFQRNSQLYLVLLTVLVFLLVRQAPVDYTQGDSEHVLLTAQAIVQQGTIKLDAYFEKAYGGKILDYRGHRYSYQPLGTSFFALPFVWTANLQGKDMADPDSNAELQRFLAALAVAASFVLIYLISRCYLGTAGSLLLAVTFVLGGSIASTMGAALWSHDLALVFALLVVLLLVLDAQGRVKAGWATALGLLLFAAYLVRPTMMAFVVAVFVYLLIWRRPLVLKTALGFAVPLVLLLVFFWIEYGQLLPYYYQPFRLRSGSTPEALYGLLLSPGRGLLIYNPTLVLVLLGLVAGLTRLGSQPLFWLAGIWLMLFTASLSRWANWWGGWSFGSRLMIDVMPALLLLTLLVWREMRDALPPTIRRVSIVTFVALAAVGEFFNTAQGLFNEYTRTWNAWHNPGESYADVAYMLDWKYPQFLASPRQLERRTEEYRLAERLQAVPLGQPIAPDSASVVFEGWYDVERQGDEVWRWSAGQPARIFFKVAPFDRAQVRALSLELDSHTYQGQDAAVLLNGVTIGSIDAQNRDPDVFAIRPSLLRAAARPREFNVLEIRTPRPLRPSDVQPGNGDQRLLGFALRTVRLTQEP